MLIFPWYAEAQRICSKVAGLIYYHIHIIVALRAAFVMHIHTDNTNVADTSPAFNAHILFFDLIGLFRRFTQKVDPERVIVVAYIDIVQGIYFIFLRRVALAYLAPPRTFILAGGRYLHHITPSVLIAPSGADCCHALCTE